MPNCSGDVMGVSPLTGGEPVEDLLDREVINRRHIRLVVLNWGNIRHGPAGMEARERSL